MSAKTLSAWGRVSAPGREIRSEDLGRATEGAALTRGLGRSYGDSALPSTGVSEVVGSVLADRVLAFDEASGRLHAEAGLSIFSLNRMLMHRGWFTPVTPGTQFVTLGGMVASDVHGKNHHVAGTIGRHVEFLTLRVPNGGIVRCSRTERPELFAATLGGMGLTGHILDVALTLERIPTPWIWQESFRVPNVDAYIDALKESAADWPMTVGWIDCLTRGAKMGRGILMRGRWATREEAPDRAPKWRPRVTLPPIFPSWTINDLTVRAFNALYYGKHPRRMVRGIGHPESFFYPLDAIRHWNRVYGKAGFTQYQCVLPDSAGRSAARRFLERCTEFGGASFLCVIKDCGPEGEGLLSFPEPGISIAIDFAIRPQTAEMVHALNEFVIEHGGRIYLTKDTFTTAEQFRRMDPRVERFLAVRKTIDPEGLLRSAQSVRIFGDRP